MEEKKKGKGLVVALVLFILVSLGLGGYIGYEKFIAKDTTNTESANKESKTKVKEKELDINGRLVQELYSRVKPAGGSCYTGWNYKWNVPNGERKDFYTEGGDEEIKMAIVAHNLLVKAKGEYYCASNYTDADTNKIPETVEDGHKSICKWNKVNKDNKNQSYYEKDYVEKVYKNIFGSNAQLNTSTYMKNDPYGVEEYVFVPELNKYVSYLTEGGGTCGPDYKEEKITKAIKNSNTLKIYADWLDVTYEPNEKGEYIIEDKYKKEEKTKVIYTFKLEDDGMYSFVSRVKENK